MGDFAESSGAFASGGRDFFADWPPVFPRVYSAGRWDSDLFINSSSRPPAKSAPIAALKEPSPSE